MRSATAALAARGLGASSLAGQPEGMEDADWADTVARNKEHLVIMLAKDFWTTEDLSPLQAASA
jgi:hypothetical protein